MVTDTVLQNISISIWHFSNNWHYINAAKEKIIMNRGKHELKEFVYLHNRSYSERVSEGELARIHVYPKP